MAKGKRKFWKIILVVLGIALVGSLMKNGIG